MAKIDAIDVPKLLMTEVSAPSTPASGKVYIYAKADGLMYSKDDAGVETLMSGGAGSGTAATVGCRVYASSSLSLNNASDTLLTFDSERFDTNTFHDTSSNTGRLTVPSGKAGKYLIGCALNISASPGTASYTYFKVTFQAGGSAIIAVQMIGNDAGVNYATSQTVYALAVGDYVECYVRVNAGSKQAVTAANYSPEFYCILLGT